MVTLVVLGSPNSPYLRKTRVAATERAVPLEFRANSPWTRDSLAARHNPLAKIPLLILEDGSTLYDSRVIVEFLDTRGDAPRLIPPDDTTRIAVKRWEALADGVCDAVGACFLEMQYAAEQRRPDWIERQQRKITAGVAAIAEQLGGREWCMAGRLTLADVAVICALEYVEFRTPQVLAWRQKHPTLASWAVRVGGRPSVAQTAPPKPGESVEQAQTFIPGVV